VSKTATQGPPSLGRRCIFSADTFFQARTAGQIRQFIASVPALAYQPVEERFKDEFIVCHWLGQCEFLREKVRSLKRDFLGKKE